MVCQAQGLGERPDVIVGEAQGLDLGELGVLGKRGEDLAQRVQRGIEVVHAVALTVVGLQSTGLLDALHRLGRLGAAGNGSRPGGAPLALMNQTQQPRGPAALGSGRRAAQPAGPDLGSALPARPARRAQLLLLLLVGAGRQRGEGGRGGGGRAEQHQHVLFLLQLQGLRFDKHPTEDSGEGERTKRAVNTEAEARSRCQWEVVLRAPARTGSEPRQGRT